MLAHIHSAVVVGIDAIPVRVEIDVQPRGLPGWNMVGLLETAVKEARDRVTSAIKNSGYTILNRKTTINLSPASLKKSGSHFDLPIAIGLLCANEIVDAALASRFMVAGELALSGHICPVGGILAMALSAKEEGLDGIIVPAANAWEAKFAGIGEVIPASSLAEVVDFLNGGPAPVIQGIDADTGFSEHSTDFSEVRGQPFAKRGLEIAAAGGHNVALKGPPGTGKTMLAERLPTILPPLGTDEAIEVLKIKSSFGLLEWSCELPHERPFRAPHHSASYAGLVGGGLSGAMRIGEISLAHAGVLFLDEIAEFRRDAIEALRQPIESGFVRIARSGACIEYPARFMLVAAFNPCRCGYLTHPARPCICTVPDIRRYQSKLSGPLLDRIDIHVEVSPPPHEALIELADEELSAKIRERVLAAREVQVQRYGSTHAFNAHLSGREIMRHCRLSTAERSLLKSAAKNLNLSGRSIHRILKVARTIADLAGSEDISSPHISEALQFRPTTNEIF